MKYTVIFGSPRKEGNTKQLLELVMGQLGGNGTGDEIWTEIEIGDETRTGDAVQIDLFDVYDSRIEGCRACLGCQANGDGSLANPNEISCVIDDDMQVILRSIASSDMLIIAAPVYIWSLPAPVKAVVDRLVYSSCKQYGDDPNGPYLLEGKRLAVITTCGYPVDKGADLLEEQMIRFCKHTRMEYAGMLCERQRNLKEPFMDEEKTKRAVDFALNLKLYVL